MKLTVRNGQSGFEQHGEFWKNLLPLKEAERAWICGPPIFNRKIQQILADEGLDPEKIILL